MKDDTLTVYTVRTEKHGWERFASTDIEEAEEYANELKQLAAYRDTDIHIVMVCLDPQELDPVER